MSLVICIPYDDGIIIAADKRISWATGYRDDFLKIERAGQYTAVATTGGGLNGDFSENTKTWHFDFSATSTLVDAINHYQISGDIRLHAKVLQQILYNEFAYFLRTEQGLCFAPALEEPKFVTRIFHYDQEAKKFQTVNLVMSYLDWHSKPSLEMIVATNETSMSFSGRAELLLKLLNDNMLLQSLCDIDKARFLSEPICGDLNEETAIEVTSYFIWLTNWKLNVVLENDNTVSKNCAIYAIRRDTGFKQIHEDFVWSPKI